MALILGKIKYPISQFIRKKLTCSIQARCCSGSWWYFPILWCFNRSSSFSYCCSSCQWLCVNMKRVEKRAVHNEKFCYQFRTNGRQLKVRLGEWDASQATEALAPQEYIVSRIFIHPLYNAGNLKNSIAILRLATPVTLGQVILTTLKFFIKKFILIMF